jgi:hypothetical protein
LPLPFLRFEQLLLPPPLAALSGLLLAVGIAGLGIAAARAVRGSRFEAIDGAAGCIVAAAVLGATLHALALLGVLRLWPLRIVAGSLAAVGLFFVVSSAPLLLHKAAGLLERWRRWPFLDRALVVLLCVAATGLLLAALGPACDADSIAYHLGVPLDWLRHGGAYPRPDWYHARLVGVGEMLDLLGLAAGSDCFGAVLQAEGAALAALAVSVLARRDRDRLLAVALVIASPVLLSLVTSEKPQVLPAAATAVALVMLVGRWNGLDRSTLVLAFGCAAFAMSCKYSFLLSGSIVTAMGLFAARRTRMGFALGSSAVAILLVAAPVYLRNVAFYGDPVSPFLERWRASPDPSLIAFADQLRDYGGPRGPLGILWLAARALASRSITGVLGIGVLSPLLAPWRNPSARRLLGAAACATVLGLAFGQLTPRFFLEPCWWSIAAIGLRERPIPIGWLAITSFQASVAACGAIICAAVLFPGTWSATWRDRVLRARAPGYAEARWLDEILRPDDVLLTGIESKVFLPRPFVVEDRFDGLRQPEDEGREIQWLEQDAGLSVLTVQSDDDLSPAIAAAVQGGAPIGAPTRFRALTRNPWLPQPDFELQAIRIAR